MPFAPNSFLLLLIILAPDPDLAYVLMTCHVHM